MSDTKEPKKAEKPPKKVQQMDLENKPARIVIDHTEDTVTRHLLKSMDGVATLAFTDRGFRAKIHPKEKRTKMGKLAKRQPRALNIRTFVQQRMHVRSEIEMDGADWHNYVDQFSKDVKGVMKEK